LAKSKLPRVAVNNKADSLTSEEWLPRATPNLARLRRVSEKVFDLAHATKAPTASAIRAQARRLVEVAKLFEA
jgi:hypothetical protein